MMGDTKPVLGKLYLHKGKDGDIYVPTYCEKAPIKHLTQYQIDGIRFLYKQYKKKKPGVVLNDPSGCGKTLQAVLFLYAIKDLLEKPILILCNENEKKNWKEHFHQWVDFDDVFETTYPMTRKNIYINSINDIALNARNGYWGAIVIEDDEIHKKAVTTKADFKIWLTSLDIKENLTIFPYICQWFYQKNYLKYDDYITVRNMKDKIKRSILLDALLEDIVIRHNVKKDDPSLFKKIEEIQPIGVTSLKTYVSKKNKDATGTKIKRSKMTLLNENKVSLPAVKCEQDQYSNISADTNINKLTINNNESDNNAFSVCNENSNVSNDVEIESKESEKNDIESFIRDQKPITCEEFEKGMSDIDSLSQHSGESKIEIEELYIVDELYAKSENSPDDFSVANNKNDDNSIESSEADIKKEIDVNMDSNSSSCINGNSDVKQIPNDCDELDNKNEEIDIREEDVVINIDGTTVVLNKRKIHDKPIKTYGEKFAQIEEIAMKKFKGSLLDSIFNK